MRNLILGLTILGSAATSVHADSVTIEPDRDNTIFSESDGLSNGQGEYVFAGLTRAISFRRALIRFDVDGAIPAEAVPTSVTLSMYCTRSISDNVPVSLHRLTAEWGEGASDALFEEGTGIEAEPGDATWGYRFFQTDSWASPGGDYIATATATAQVGFALEHYTWTSEQMLADVQGWIADPATNHGWIVIGDEATFGSAKRFGSRQNPNSDQRPQLTIEYEVTPPPCFGDLDGNNAVDIGDLAILLSNFGGSGLGDLDGDNDVDISDLSTLLSRFGTIC